MGLTRDFLRELVLREPGSPVLSVHLRTDPRDPANTAQTPAWQVALRNGAREVSEAAEELPREERMAVRDLLEQVERDLLALGPDERGRGIAWFVSADRSLDERLTLQLPPRDHTVRLDVRPFVSPLVDVADRGRATGIILVSTEAMRLVHWEGGRVEEPARSLYEYDPGEWRDYAAYAMADPGSSAIHVDTVERRYEEWHRRFLREAATRLASRLAELGWERLVVVGDERASGGLVGELPAATRELVVAEIDANLIWADPSAVAERLDEELERAWEREARAGAERAVEAARTGGLGAIGWAEVLDSLVQQRVRHLFFVLGAEPSLEGLPPHALEALGSPPRELLVERAVEQAAASGADVTALPEEASAAVAEAGAVAALRY